MIHNFDLRLAGTLTAIDAEVLDSPSGQTPAAATVHCELGSVAWQDLDAATTAGLRNAGLALWRGAFGAPAVAELWRASLAKIDVDDILRLRLTVDTPALAALPWELLFDATLGRFLALDGRTPVTRFVRLPIAPLPWPEDRPLHLLFTGSSPEDLPALDVKAEQDAVEQGVAPMAADGKLAIAAIGERATLSDVLSAAVREQVDLWHFAGHGYENGLIFANRQGKAAPAEAGTLGQMLAGEGVRLAVLNACRTGAAGGQAASVAGALLRADISAVVAMQADVSDGAAGAFARAFYQAIAAGHPVDRSVTFARKAIFAEGEAAWWVPALFMRTPEGHIWQPQEGKEPEQASEPAPAVSITVTGSGSVAYGPGAIAAGEGGVVAGTIYGGVHIGEPPSPPPDPEQRRADQARTRYLQRLRQRCNALPLAAMGGEEEAGDEVTLDRVYVELDTRTRVPLDAEQAGKRGRPSDVVGRPGAEDRALPAMEAATENRKLALLGDAGSGKSTFTRQLAALLAGAQVHGGDPPAGWPSNTLPLLISLRELAPSLAGLALEGLSDDRRDRALVDAVRSYWLSQLEEMRAGDLASGVENALDDGAALLIFDGLDEVSLALRHRTRQAIQAVARAFPANRIVVTCRIRSYTELAGFASHTLAAFDPNKIRRFIAGWYQAQHDLGRMNREKARDNTADLQGAALSPKLLELASNPMLLTTMAIIHQKEVGLPEERVRLYDLAVQVLLLRWQKRKGLAVSDELAAVLRDNLKLRGMVESLAYRAHNQQARGRDAGELARGELLALLEGSSYLGDAGLAAEFLDYVDLRAGLLVGHGGDDAGQPQSYSFPHRTFQEYLAGCQMIEGRNAAREFWQRAAEGDYWALAARLGAEELLYNRRNVKDLLDLAYDLCPAAEPATDGQWRAALWSGQMAALLGRDAVAADDKLGGGKAYLDRVVSRLVGVMRHSPRPAVERAEAGRALARLGDPRRGVGLDPATGLPDVDWVDVPAGAFRMGTRKEDVARLEQKYGEPIWGFENELPQHELFAADFRIARYPITVAQFDAFVQAGGYATARFWKEAGSHGFWRPGEVKGSWFDSDRNEGVEEWASAPADYGDPDILANHPVVGVNWWEAMAFSRWLTEQLQAVGKLEPGWQVTLPSEAEWEKASRGEDGRDFPWLGEIDPNKANYGAAGIDATSAVGCFPGGASPYGVEDMSGNIWEWTRGLYDKYPYPAGSTDLVQRENPAAGVSSSRVVRGGSYGSPDNVVRCAARYRNYPDGRFHGIGFRCVCVPIA